MTDPKLIVIEVRVPAVEVLSANRKRHWADTARRTKALRERGAWAWRKATAGRRIRWERARCTAWLTFSTKSGHPRRDGNNYSSLTKPLIDGIITGPARAEMRQQHGAKPWPGLLPDDSSAYLDGPDHRITALADPTLPRGWVRVRLEFEEIS
ncbi:MAG: hypothetical protein IPJ61_17745 [Tessaracoccus sp.]|uniref:hypothetical protein n=1 Tax=Tessaracoccus sp. TaxID=1971211 RepID=UPI001EC30BA3|nr:hypothetical protein [Tessaracoccus sp.]MBK7822848.1 hypothetical protein [Tessaracoccus sp.]